MSKPHLLMPSPMMPMIMDQLDADFAVTRLWQAADRAQTLADIATSIEAIAISPHVPVQEDLLARLPNLKIIGNFGVGYDSVDAAWCGRNGVIVTNTPDVLTEEVADTALGLLLMAARELGAAERHLRSGTWLERAYPLTPTTLRGRHVGIVGLGRIGKAIARRLEAFAVDIAYHGRRAQADVPHRFFPDLITMAEAVDTLMVVAPATAETHHLINAEVLAALGPDGIVINIGRGSVVDEKALIAALETGTIANAGLDVFEDEPRVPDALIAMEKVALLPHVGSASIATRNAMGQLVVDNLLAWKAGRPPLTPVPETPFTAW